MSKYNDLLIEFMVEKNKIVKRHTGLLLTLKRDIDELRSWSEVVCYAILTDLDTAKDGFMCPWCLIHWACIGCGYGERNGKCRDQLSSQSRYSKIKNRLSDSPCIRLLPGMKELVKTTKQKLRGGGVFEK